MTGQGHRSEFDLIAELLAPLADNSAAVGLRDDAALVDVPSGQQLVISTDMLLAGVHFPETADASLIANRLMACNISDLAAKGAKPYGCLLNLGVAPQWDDAFLESFVAAFGAGLKKYGMQLWGGDTVKAAQGFVGLTVHGLVPQGEMLTRSGAQNGDDVYVTGTIGDGFLGLHHALNGTDGETLAAYAAPMPPLAFGQGLRGNAHAAIDISDGLMADLAHMCRASGGMMNIQAVAVPLSAEGQAHHNLPQLVGGGDDLQIAFTAAPDKQAAIEVLAQNCGISVTRIGRFSVQAGEGDNLVRLWDENASEVAIEQHGFRHF